LYKILTIIFTYRHPSKFKVSAFQPLTATQWANISDLVEKTYTTGRPRKVNLRSVVAGIRYLVSTGCQWRNVDTTYGTKSVLRYAYALWRSNFTWSKMLKRLILLRRVQVGCDAAPDLGAIDSQRTKVVPLIHEAKGIDGNKKINGRKRHIIVASEGLLLTVYVGAADENDGKEGVKMLPELQKNYENVKKLHQIVLIKKHLKQQHKHLKSR
jgi:putative transposase